MNILVSAGPTREPIDPVRFISNYSTGLLGWEIARVAKKRGHQVILVSGPTALAKPKDVCSVDIQTSRELEKELNKRFSWCDCLIMTAAVCDFRPHSVAKNKIKRGKKDELILKLRKNPDILKGLGRRKGKNMPSASMSVRPARMARSIRSTATFPATFRCAFAWANTGVNPRRRSFSPKRGSVSSP